MPGVRAGLRLQSVQLQSHWRGGHAAWLLQSRGSERVGLASRLCPGAEHCLVPVRWDEGSRPLSPSAGLDGAGTRAVACFVYLTEMGQMWQTWLFPAWPLFLTKFWQKEQGICGLSFVLCLRAFLGCRPLKSASPGYVSQLCPTLCNPVGCSLPGSSVRAILQARVLEWVAVPSPGDLPNPGIEPGFPTLQADALPSEPPGELK